MSLGRRCKSTTQAEPENPIQHRLMFFRIYSCKCICTYVCTYICMYLSLCIGVFSDVLNLIFQDKSSCQITSDGVKVVGNVDLKSDKMHQREDILSKCLQFLRLLARYA